MALQFKRKLYQRMLKWKQEEQGASALLIKGARRVGKSTLAESFAKAEYETYLLIDFSIASAEVHGLFRDFPDIDYLFLRLQLLYGVSLTPRKSVIIFDEVQMEPYARQAIKHLVKDRRYDYIETGSLISIRQNVKDIVLPSEETQVCLYPMDYEEFRWALGDAATIPLLQHSFQLQLPLGDGVNRKLMRDFRLYMLIGGMPQAVEAYLQHRDLSHVDDVKRRILSLYEDDFMKLDPTGRTSRLFRFIPQQLAQSSTRFKARGVLGNSVRPAILEETIANMADSMTVNIAYHANDPHVGLAMHGSMEAYKLYMGDTGLFVTQAFMDKDVTENVIYIMDGQKGKESTGGTMRLGDYKAKLVKGSKTGEIYGSEEIVERHRHRFEVNQKFLKEIERGGIEVSGTSPNGKLVEFVEAPGCKFFQATQAHPEFKSRPLKVHPLFQAFMDVLAEN